MISQFTTLKRSTRPNPVMLCTHHPSKTFFPLRNKVESDTCKLKFYRYSLKMTAKILLHKVCWHKGDDVTDKIATNYQVSASILGLHDLCEVSLVVCKCSKPRDRNRKYLISNNLLLPVTSNILWYREIK